MDTRSLWNIILGGHWKCMSGFLHSSDYEIASYLKITNQTRTTTKSCSFSMIQKLVNEENITVNSACPFINANSWTIVDDYTFLLFDGDDKSGAKLDIWNINSYSNKPFGLISSFESILPTIHGPIFSIMNNKTIKASLKHNLLFYIADSPKAKVKEWFCINKEESNKEKIIEYGKKFEFSEHWGEHYYKFSHPSIFVWNIDDKFSGIGEQPIALNFKGSDTCSVFYMDLLPDETGLIITTVENNPMKLGYCFCFRRPSKILLLNDIDKYKLNNNIENELCNLNITPITISSDDEFVRAATVMPYSGKDSNIRCSIIYYSTSMLNNISVHWFSIKLCIQDLYKSDKGWICNGPKRVCVENYLDPINTIHPKVFQGFCGLFGDELNTINVVPDTRWIITSTIQGPFTILVAINVDTCEVCKIEFVPKNKNCSLIGCYNILDVTKSKKNNSWYLLIVFSSPIIPSLAILAEIKNFNSTSNHILYANEIKTISSPIGIEKNILDTEFPKFTKSNFNNCSDKFVELLSNISYEIFQDKHILMKPKSFGNLGKIPIVVNIHGGPNSVSMCNFTITNCFFVSLGYAVLLPNYRGSIGFGDNYSNCLIGNAGDLEVKDVHDVMENVILKYKDFIDSKCCFIFGGSYGGFITLHLVGMYPNRFNAACSINGVTNAATKIGVTDIPDISLGLICESNVQFWKNASYTSDQIKRLYENSPIARISNVTTPLLLAIGTDDIRVPPSQTIEYYKILKSIGKAKVKFLQYPSEHHSIIKLEHLTDFLLNVVDWFGRNGGIPIKIENK
ncbi:prolyl oligopeptidase family protein [Cryptosporidium serpentis]